MINQQTGACHILKMDTVVGGVFATKHVTGQDGAFFFTMKNAEDFFHLNEDFIYVGKVMAYSESKRRMY